jgi:subtilase family serine protease
MVSILFYAVNEDNNHNSTIYDTKNSKPVLIVKDSTSQLSESIPSSSSIIDIADTVIKKDERLELVPMNP